MNVKCSALLCPNPATGIARGKYRNGRPAFGQWRCAEHMPAVGSLLTTYSIQHPTPRQFVVTEIDTQAMERAEALLSIGQRHLAERVVGE